VALAGFPRGPGPVLRGADGLFPPAQSTEAAIDILTEKRGFIVAMTKNKVTGLGALVVGVAYFLATLNLKVAAVSDPIGPRFFPFILGGCMIFVGLLLVLKKEELTEKNRAVIFSFPADKGLLIRILQTCVAGFIFGLILDPVGYLISSVLFMTTMMFITYGPRRYLLNVTVGFIFGVSTYVVFFEVLQVSLPRGILAF
jgi:putative tricarboxylic transport membrane protein